MLSDAQIRKASLPDGKKVLRLHDGGGLYFRIRRGARGLLRDWVFRFTYAGKRREVRIGPYPEVSLREARARAAE
ncbi:MAG: DUF4102 domain-containing protein, partial [Zetaproteobacteria bacterium]